MRRSNMHTHSDRSGALPALLLTAGIAVFALSTPTPAVAQGNWSVAGYSMTGARGTALRDIDAALVNPALLGLPGRRAFSLRFFSLNTHLDQTIMSMGRLERWSGAFLDAEERESYLNSLGKAASIKAQAEVGSIGLQIGRLSLGAYHVVNAEARVPTDLFDLVLNGNELNRTYHFGEFGIASEAVSVLHG